MEDYLPKMCECEVACLCVVMYHLAAERFKLNRGDEWFCLALSGYEGKEVNWVLLTWREDIGRLLL